MFWFLYLAHLLGDYPLQPGWLVDAKRRLTGLTLHISIHLALLLAIVGPLRLGIWPQLVVLAAVHFTIDLVKMQLSRVRPDWIVAPYFIDQGVHLISMILVAQWIERQIAVHLGGELITWLIYACGYLLVTYVWFITERLIAHGDRAYVRELEEQFWPRMAGRAAFMSGLLLIGFGLGWRVTALTLPLPYLTGAYRKRAFLTDLSVALVVAATVLWFG